MILGDANKRESAARKILQIDSNLTNHTDSKDIKEGYVASDYTVVATPIPLPRREGEPSLPGANRAEPFRGVLSSLFFLNFSLANA